MEMLGDAVHHKKNCPTTLSIIYVPLINYAAGSLDLSTITHAQALGRGMDAIGGAGTFDAFIAALRIRLARMEAKNLGIGVPLPNTSHEEIHGGPYHGTRRGIDRIMDNLVATLQDLGYTHYRGTQIPL